MPTSQLQWRALAAQGVLLLVISMWSFICAARPVPLISTHDRTNLHHINSFQQFLQVLNVQNGNSFSANGSVSKEMKNSNASTTWMCSSQSTSNTTLALNYGNINAIDIETMSDRAISSSTDTSKYSDQLSASNRMDSDSDRSYTDQMEVSALPTSNGLDSEMLVTENDRSIASNASPSSNYFDVMMHAIDNSHQRRAENSDVNTMVTKLTPAFEAVTAIPTTAQSVFLNYLNRNFSGTNSDLNAISARRIRSRGERSAHTPRHINSKRSGKTTAERTERTERSVNLSMNKSTKRIQILIKNRLLQLLPDGVVNGTQNDESEYSK